MMRKQIMALSLWSLSFVGFANDLKVEHNAQLRVRHENYNIYEGRSDKVDYTAMRFRAGFQFDVGEGRKLYLSPQVLKGFGDLNANNQQTSGDKNSSAVEFHEAYADIGLGLFDMSLKVGRQQINYGNNNVFGTRNWTPGGQAFDAAKLTAPVGMGELDVVYSKIVNDDTTTTSDDITLTFLYYRALDTDHHELDAYVIFNNRSVDDDNRDTRSVGLRYQYKSDSFGFSTENIFQDLNKQDHSAYNLNLDLDYKLAKFTPFATFSLATFRYDQLYANRHSHNGLIDIVGRKNLVRASLGAKYKINKRWSAKLEFFQFKKQSENDLAYNQAVSSTLNGDINEDDLGQEIDVSVKYSPRSKESFVLAYSQFMHGDYFAKDDTSRFVYAQYLLKF